MAEATRVSFSMKDESVESKTSGKSFGELYDLDKELGQGVFSVVHLGTHKATGDRFAIKIINKPEMEEFDKKCLQCEIDVLSQLSHPRIIQLYDVFDSPNHIHLALELVEGGELLSRLLEKQTYTEREARDVCRMVMEGMDHCHQHKIAHRDLKAENLLLSSKTDDTSIKIADFGFAKPCPTDTSLKTQCGSAQHVAPEILKNVPYGTKVDMWALGVIHYTLIGGRPPFWAPNNQAVFQKILHRQFEFTDQLWGHISPDCKDMISGLLTLDPQDRWSAQQVLDCPWMQGEAADLDKTSLHSNIEELRAFKAKEKVKAAVYALIGLNRLQFDGEQQLPGISEEQEETKEELPELEPILAGEDTSIGDPSFVTCATFEEDEVVEDEVVEEEEIVEEKEEEEEEEFCGIVTRDLYTAFTIADCTTEPQRKEYFALAQVTGDFFATVLKESYGERFDVVEMTLRKSLYNSGKPNDEYNVYIEWDITAHFDCPEDELPSRREVCGKLVMANLEKYITDYVRQLEDTSFAMVTNVFFGHFAC